MSNISEAQGGATGIHCDSVFAIAISKNPIFGLKLRIMVKSS